MGPRELELLLQAVKDGHSSIAEAKTALVALHDEQLGFAHVDHHRAVRQGAPEVIYGAGKSDTQIAAIAHSLLERNANVLCTRVADDVLAAVKAAHPLAREHAVYHASARCLTVTHTPPPQLGSIAVVCAGTSDLPVADETAITAAYFGIEVHRINDVGVAGLQRLARALPTLRSVDACVVVAGMEGALASVIGGQLACPVIAVPTSVGYGVSFGGVSALLGMLTSCASGVVVVNIDNGFGAAAAAHRLLQKRPQAT